MISALNLVQRSAKRSVLILSFFCSGLLHAHPTDTVYLTRKQAEQILLDNNVRLLASKLQIDIAEARMVQARLWPNPRLSVDEVNLWAKPSQLSMGEELPAIFNNGWGKNQQISAQLEQTLQMAGKRRKLIALEQVRRDMATAYFQEVLRNLRVEFRNLLTELQYLQAYQEVYARQIPEARKLLAAYERLAPTGNINRADVVRLKTLVLELMDENGALQKQMHSIQKELAVLLGVSANNYIRLSNEDFVPAADTYEMKSLPLLIQRAISNRPDLALAELETQEARRILAYEKAESIPDLTLSVGYDRGGNFMYNFVGFGFGLDIPIFHRNQGNIKAARFATERASLLLQEHQRRVEAEVTEAYQNLKTSIELHKQIEGGFEQELDLMLGGYTRNFINRNVGMLEFLDFMDSYFENKKIILNANRALNRALEELVYAVGTSSMED